MLALAARFYGWSHAELMAQSLGVTLGYLHHAQAVAAVERLDAVQIQALPYMKKHDQRRLLERLQRTADGLPAEDRTEAQTKWDAAWARLRGMLGPGQLAPGERVVIPPRS